MFCKKRFRIVLSSCNLPLFQYCLNILAFSRLKSSTTFSQRIHFLPKTSRIPRINASVNRTLLGENESASANSSLINSIGELLALSRSPARLLKGYTLAPIFLEYCYLVVIEQQLNLKKTQILQHQ